MEKVMEFSNEELQEIAGCPMDYYDTTRNLAKALLSERAEREKNPGVWDGAPEWSDMVNLTFVRKDGASTTYFGKTYTRTLPKTKAREIAERKAREWVDVRISGSQKTLEETIEAAILEALGGEK